MVAENLIIIPFVFLLLSIALIPFLKPEGWEKLYPYISVLAAVPVVFYFFSLNRTGVLLNAVQDYVMFISLLGSLFIISGGIFIDIRGLSTPARNVILLAAGAILANIAGTTGASMLLIRPFIKLNKIRISAYHIVFFIFIVSNIGGSLTPIGDPPLFIGFLKGVPFFWMTKHAIILWFISITVLLLVFYFIDLRNFRKQPLDVEALEINTVIRINVKGKYNFILMAIVVGSVFLERPYFLREIIMIVCALFSYKITHKDIHHGNYFNFHPIKEVAWLFAAVFITVTPVIELLKHNSSSIGLSGPTAYFWLTGLLSSVLDNAPAYLTFLSTAMSSMGFNVSDLSEVSRFADEKSVYLLSISVSSVFFGAFTYLGNGPNFMIKNVAQSYGIKLPGFIGFIIRYSLPVLVPLFIVVWILIAF